MNAFIFTNRYWRFECRSGQPLCARARRRVTGCGWDMSWSGRRGRGGGQEGGWGSVLLLEGPGLLLVASIAQRSWCVRLALPLLDFWISPGIRVDCVANCTCVAQPFRLRKQEKGQSRRKRWNETNSGGRSPRHCSTCCTCSGARPWRRPSGAWTYATWWELCSRT